MQTKMIMRLLSMLILIAIIPQVTEGFTVHMFDGITGSNVYIVTDSQKTLMIETGGIDDAPAVLLFLSQLNIDTIDLIFITHGHPDHFGGAGQISSQYQGVTIAVGSSDIKNELVEYAQTSGITDYDFSSNLQVVNEKNSVISHFNLDITDNFAQGESEYAATLYSSSQNILFSGDIIYITAHLYLGATVDLTRVNNWYYLNLPDVNPGGSLGLDDKTTIYPGHGIVGDPSYVNENLEYLNFFLDTLFDCEDGEFPALSTVAADLLAEYPTYLGSAFPAFLVSNTAWTDAQNSYGDCGYNIDYFGGSSSSNAVQLSISALLLFLSLLVYL